MAKKFRQGSRPGLILIGGLVDETMVTLAVYGADLDPPEITRLLGCEPTKAHRRGDPRPTKSPLHPSGFLPPWKQGTWQRSETVLPPKGPEEATRQLLDRLPQDEAWAHLGVQYDARLFYMIAVEEWNRGFDLSHELLSRVAALNLRMAFDIYADRNFIDFDEAR